MLFENCEELTTEDCEDDCVSGDRGCAEEPCFVEGIRCQGVEVDIGTDLESADECLELCAVS